MSKTTILSLLLTIVIMPNLCSAQSKADKRYIKGIFHCIKNKDAVRYENLFPDFETYYHFAEKFYIKRNTRDSSLTKSKYLKKKYHWKNRFSKSLKLLEASGIELNKIKLQRYHTEIFEDTINHLKWLKGILYITVKKRTQIISFTNALWQPKGWLGGEINVFINENAQNVRQCVDMPIELKVLPSPRYY